MELGKQEDLHDAVFSLYGFLPLPEQYYIFEILQHSTSPSPSPITCLGMFENYWSSGLQKPTFLELESCMTQWLRALDDLVEDPALVPSTLIVAHNQL